MASTWAASAPVMGRTVTPAGRRPVSVIADRLAGGSAAGGPARGEWRRRFAAAAIAVLARRRAAGGGQDRAGDRPQLPYLLGGERVEQGPADLLDVAGGGRHQHRVPLVGELRELPAPVGRAVPAADPAALLQAGHSVRDPALARRSSLGELAHAQGVARRLGEPHQDLVVGQRDPGVALQLRVDGREKRVAGPDEGAPGLLLLVRQPPGAGSLHGPSIAEIVERLTSFSDDGSR